MNKSYNRINWKNYPSIDSPLNDENLNKIDYATDEIDNRVITLDTTKATKTEVATMIADVSFNETTGIFTFTRKNGATFTVDTLLEKIIINFDFDRDAQKLIITMEDGTKKEIDLSVFITQYEFVDTETIDFSLGNDGKVTAIVKEGGIQEKHLRPDYLADIKVESAKAVSASSSAQTYANQAKSYAIGDTNSAKYYYEQTRDMEFTSISKDGESYFAQVSVADVDTNYLISAFIQRKSDLTGNSIDLYVDKTEFLRPIHTPDVVVPSGISEYNGISTVPAAGAITGLNNTLEDMSEKRSYIGSAQFSNGNWFNVISVRHRNGAADGNNFGMYFASSLTSISNLTWRQQNGGTWGAEKTIIDSSNYSSQINTSTLINTLTEGTSDPQDNDYYVTQYAGGGTSTTTYHRRKHSSLYNYLKGKFDSVYAPAFTSGTWRNIGNDAAIGDIDVAGTLGIIGNNGTTTLRLCEYGKSDKSGGNISYTSSGFTFNNSINSDAQGIFTTIGNGTNPTFAGLSLQLREYGKQGANVQTNGAGPGIGFHWYNRFAKMLVLGTDGLLHFYNQDCSDATIVAANCPNTTVGSATQPIYLGSNGVPTACTYTLGKSVPSNAVFTDTHNTAYLYAGKSTGSSNAATENGNTYLILSDGGTVRSRRKISGSGTVTVSSDSSGNITINGSGGSGGSSALDVEQVSSFLVYTNYGDKFTLKGNGNDLAYITQEDGCIGPLALGTNGDVILFSRTSALDFYEDAFEPWLYEGVAGSGKIDLGSSSAKWKNIYAATGTIQTSDRDQKNTIEDVDFDKAKKFIMGLKPSTFKFNDGESDRTHWGLIAQDIEELLDVLGWTTKDFAGFVKSSKTERVEILYEDDDEKQHIRIEDRAIEGEYSYSLRYDEFIAPMIRMEQSHENDIIELKKIVEKQQNELDYLRRVVAKIYDVFGMDFPEC